MNRARRDLVEVGATVLLAFAAVATAWSSYQAARWNGEQAKASSAVNKARIEAARASDLANAQGEIEVVPRRLLLQAFSQGVQLFRSRVQPLGVSSRRSSPPSTRGWRPGRSGIHSARTRPPTARTSRRPGASLTPFAMPEYRLAAARVRRIIQRSTNYVLGVVLFAVALFFAGMSTKLTSPGPRKALLLVGWVVFAGAAAWIAASPVSVSI